VNGTRVYLAGPFASRPILALARTELQQIGWTVSSRWPDSTEDSDTDTSAEVQAQAAVADLEDIRQASDLVVVFTAQSVGLRPAVSGGRHVETGYALALRLPVIVVGEPENVFHHLPQVTVVPDWHQAVLELADRLVQHHAPRAVEKTR
jgi:nucleoside 2-deoxyribosyltransferase